MANANRPRRPRTWVDALVATALRWNDRLSRPVGADASARPPSRRVEVGAAPAAPPPAPAPGHK